MLANEAIKKNRKKLLLLNFKEFLTLVKAKIYLQNNIVNPSMRGLKGKI